MSITFFAQGTDTDVTLLTGEACIVLDLAPGGYPSHLDGQLTSLDLLKAAYDLTHIQIRWFDNGQAYYLGSGQMQYLLPSNATSNHGIRGRLRRKAALLKRLAREAALLEEPVLYG